MKRLTFAAARFVTRAALAAVFIACVVRTTIHLEDLDRPHMALGDAATLVGTAERVDALEARDEVLTSRLDDAEHDLEEAAHQLAALEEDRRRLVDRLATEQAQRKKLLTELARLVQSQ